MDCHAVKHPHFNHVSFCHPHSKQPTFPVVSYLWKFGHRLVCGTTGICFNIYPADFSFMRLAWKPTPFAPILPWKPFWLACLQWWQWCFKAAENYAGRKSMTIALRHIQNGTTIGKLSVRDCRSYLFVWLTTKTVAATVKLAWHALGQTTCRTWCSKCRTLSLRRKLHVNGKILAEGGVGSILKVESIPWMHSQVNSCWGRSGVHTQGRVHTVNASLREKVPLERHVMARNILGQNGSQCFTVV